jgi:hypothetical protein
MDAAAKAKLLWVAAWLLGIAALGFAVTAFILIKGGAYPPEGAGSLGHVGMIIAGIIAGFLGLIFAGLTLVCGSKVRVVKSAGTENGQRE